MGPDFPWREAREDLFRLVLGLFEEARERGEFTVRNPELAMLMLLGGVRSVIRFGKVPRDAGLPHQIVEDFLNGTARACERPDLRSHFSSAGA
jgi:hypothetical protein